MSTSDPFIRRRQRRRRLALVLATGAGANVLAFTPARSLALGTEDATGAHHQHPGDTGELTAFSSPEGSPTSATAAEGPGEAAAGETTTTTSSTTTTTTRVVVVESPSANGPGRDLGQFMATCYDNEGETADGQQAGPESVAVDPSVIPLGTHLWIQGVGNRVADDTGGAIRGRRIDVWERSASGCQNFGVQYLDVREVS
jgi:3D (Asp-Asp-Asp) domain-containing protein